MRPEKADPAHAPPMKINLDLQRRSVKFKARPYPAPQRTLLKAYISKLVELGIFIPNAQAERQAAPLLVPIHGSQTILRCTIDQTWEALQTVLEHLSEILEYFLYTCNDSILNAEAKQLCTLL